MYCISQCSYQFDWYQSDYNQNICNLKSWQWFSIVKLSYMNETVSSIILQNDLHYLINLKVHIFFDSEILIPDVELRDIYKMLTEIH